MNSVRCHQAPQRGSRTKIGRFSVKKCTYLEESLLQSFLIWKPSAAKL